MRTAVILAGGKSRRMGTDKTRLTLGDESMLEFVVRRYSQAFDNIILSVRKAGSGIPGVTEVADLYPEAGPMAGLHSALAHTDGDEVFLTSADIPFAPPELALRLMELGRGYQACVIRRESGLIEPLFGMYRKSCLSYIENMLGGGRRRMSELVCGVSSLVVDESALSTEPLDELLLNVNLPRDFLTALEIYKRR